MPKIKIEKYEGLDLTEKEIITRSIKDVNAKLDRLAKNYGTDSQVYKSNLAKVMMAFPRGMFDNRYLTTENGVTHISQKIKYDIPEEDYLKKSQILTEKVQTIGQVKQTVEKAVKEIYNIDTNVNNIPKSQQSRLITNMYKLQDGFTKILNEFYEIHIKYGNNESSGFKPETLVPILKELNLTNQYPELISAIESNMFVMDSKDNKGSSIAKATKKTYSDMNNLILITEAMNSIFGKLESDVEIYNRFVREKRTMNL